MDALLQDLRYALRQLVRNPGFTAVAVATLALGIGANTAIFSVVDGVVIRPLPFDEPERLVSFVDAGNYKGMLLEYRDRTESFEEIGGYTSYGYELSLTGDGEPVRVESAGVTAGFFSLLGTPPMLGRDFLPEEEWAGEHRVVILSHALWQQRYGGDRGIVGSAILLDGTSHTVVGVMPPRFGFPSAATRLWVPFGIDRSDPLDLWAATAGTFVGRLRPGVTTDEASVEVATLIPSLRQLFPWQMPDDFWNEARVAPLREHLVGELRPTLLVLLGAVGLVLLIACANVANLLLARAAARRKEIAIRVAVGAGRGRIARQVLTESALLAALAGGAGLLLAVWGVELIVSGLPADTPRLAEIGLDGRVLGTALGITALTGLLFGALPAIRAAGTRTLSALADGGRTGRGRAQRRLSGTLVAAEMALAVMLVIGATLLVRSFWELSGVDPGFRSGQLVTATIAPSEIRYPDRVARQGFHEEVLERVTALPGVSRAALTTRLPFGAQAWGGVFVIEGRPDPAVEGGDWPYADIAGLVTEGWFSTMGISMVAGREFTVADRADAPPVVIVTEALAREYWPGEDPVGRRIRPPGGEWMTIVGVAADHRSRTLGGEIDTAFYRPLAQGDAGVVSVVLRSGLDASALAPGLREVVRALDRDTPVEDIQAMDELIGASVAGPRLTALLLGAFAVLALVLGAVGIYGVLSWTVSERTREFGIRMALGARAGDVLALVLREGAALAAVGVAVGLAAALAGAGILASLLHGIGARDPLSFTLVPALLLAVALLAAWLPARRATRADPLVIMRAE